MKNIALKLALALVCITNIPAHAIDILNSLIVAPRPGATVATATPVVAGVMRNDNHKPIKNKPVAIYIDGRLVATVPTNKYGVWSYALSNGQALADGCHCIQASVAQSPTNVSWVKGTVFGVHVTRVPHKSGNVSAANSIINFPFDGGYINDTTPTVIGTLLDASYQPVSGETVTVKIDSSTVGSPVSDSNGVFSYGLSSALSEASHAVDAHCVQSSVDLTTNTFTVDVTAPAAPTISAPTQNSTVTSNPVVVSGTTESGATITTFMDGDIYGDISYADGSGNWSIEYELSNGAHSVTAQASDLANNTSSVSGARSFTVSV